MVADTGLWRRPNVLKSGAAQTMSGPRRRLGTFRSEMPSRPTDRQETTRLQRAVAGRPGRAPV